MKMPTPNIDELRGHCQVILGLLDKPEAGLTSWRTALDERLRKLKPFLPTDGMVEIAVSPWEREKHCPLWHIEDCTVCVFGLEHACPWSVAAQNATQNVAAGDVHKGGTVRPGDHGESEEVR